jgi:hypothetical protein
MHKIIFSIIWILLLWFLVWPVTLFCSWFWIILQVRWTTTNVMTTPGTMDVNSFNTSAYALFLTLISHNQPFEACFPSPVKSVNDFLEKIMTWPREFGEAIRDGRQSFPTPF